MGILSNIVANIEAWLRPNMTPEEKGVELDKMAADAGEKLDWRNSIVDLMKLTNQDSSLSARAKLAKEMGYPSAFTGTADQNIWLHQKVMDHLKL
jgi:hypothetical protein